MKQLLQGISEIHVPVKEVHGVVYLIYSPPGCGKTTFGLGFPNPILIITEDGIKFDEVEYIDCLAGQPASGTKAVKTQGRDILSQMWEKFRNSLPKLHTWRRANPETPLTLVVDTVDRLGVACEAYLSRSRGKESFEEVGKSRWQLYRQEFESQISQLWQIGGVCFLSHTREVTPMGASIKRKEPGLGYTAWDILHKHVDIIGYLAQMPKLKDSTDAEYGGPGVDRFLILESGAMPRLDPYLQTLVKVRRGLKMPPFVPVPLEDPTGLFLTAVNSSLTGEEISNE